MAERRNMTTAYVRPAESMFPTSDLPDIPAYQITPAEARHSLFGTVGVFILAYTLPILYGVVIHRQWGQLDPRLALLLAAIYLGGVLLYRYTYDIGWVLNNQFRTIWSLEKDLVIVLKSAAELDQALTNERNRSQHYEAQLEILRRQKPAQPKHVHVPYDGPPVSELPDNYAPYDSPISPDDAMRAGVDVKPEQDDIDTWMQTVLRHHEEYDHVFRERKDGTGVLQVQPLKRSQFDKAIKKLNDLHILGGNSATGYHVLDVDYDGILTAYFKDKYVG